MVDQPPSAAVAIIKLASAKERYLILRRVKDPSDPWSGHFSFPGGRKENTDKSLLSTCLRETREETGLLLSSDQLDRQLPLEPAGRNYHSPILVQPFLFSISSIPRIDLDYSEIQSFLWLNAEHFKNPAHHRQVEMLPGRMFPAYPLADYFLWGFTYRLLFSILNMNCSQK